MLDGDYLIGMAQRYEVPHAGIDLDAHLRTTTTCVQKFFCASKCFIDWAPAWHFWQS